METIAVSRELLEEMLTVLNDVENRRLNGRRWRTSFELAAEVTRVLRSATVGGPR